MSFLQDSQPSTGDTEDIQVQSNVMKFIRLFQTPQAPIPKKNEEDDPYPENWSMHINICFSTKCFLNILLSFLQCYEGDVLSGSSPSGCKY